MAIQYRDNAKQALARARQVLNSGETAQLRYAALELRMALECLVYERAQNYQKEFSYKKLNTWQPKKLLALLLEVDPSVDKTATINLGLEEKCGVPAKEMTALGTDRVISLKEIKDYYDRLGSYLHTPTAKQFEHGKGLPSDKLRESCEALFIIIETSLSSKVWNADFKHTTSLPCKDCKTRIIRRIPANEDQFSATCIECCASYTLTKTADNKVYWKANQHEISCANPECGEIASIWHRDIALKSYWTCDKCRGTNTFVLSVEFTPLAHDANLG